jgi:hypothetical protein
VAGAECPEENAEEEEEDRKGILGIPRFNPRWHEWVGCHINKNGHHCDNLPRKIPYYRLNQSTLVIKQ